jgi:histone H3/H4
MNEIVKSTIMDIGKVANGLVHIANKKTITRREIESAVNIVLPGKLAKHAISEGIKAVTKYNPKASSPRTKIGRGKISSIAAMAGLYFSPSRVRKLLSAQVIVGRIGLKALIYLAAVMEYLTGKILELSGNTTRDNKRIRITNRDIMLSISSNEELNKLYAPKTYLLGGGVVVKQKVAKDTV